MMRELERILKALANRRRLAILKYLKENKEKTVLDTSEHIRLSFKSTSRHLAVLFGADIVERDQRGLQMFYKISPKQNLVAKHILSFL